VAAGKKRMDGTRELVDAAQVGTALAVLSIVALCLAVVLGAMFVRDGRRSPGLARAALLAAVGILVYPLWAVYNSIEDRLGLDSVAALLLNLALFAVVGVVVGLLARRVWPAEEPVAAPTGDAGSPSEPTEG